MRLRTRVRVCVCVYVRARACVCVCACVHVGMCARAFLWGSHRKPLCNSPCLSLCSCVVHACRAEERTANNTALLLTIAVSYSAQDDLANAARQLASQVAQGHIRPEQVRDTWLACMLLQPCARLRARALATALLTFLCLRLCACSALAGRRRSPPSTPVHSVCTLSCRAARPAYTHVRRDAPVKLSPV